MEALYTLDQANGGWLQDREKAKAFTVSEPWTPPAYPQGSRVVQWAPMHMNLEHQSCKRRMNSRWLSRDSFIKEPSSGHKESHAYLSCHIYDLTMNQSLYSKNMTAFFELSLLGCMAVWLWSPLEFGHLSRLLLEAERSYANNRSLVRGEYHT